MLRKSKLFLVGCVIFMATSSLSVFGQKSEVAVKDKRITIQMTQKPLYTIFWRLIQKYDVAIGFEESILDRNHRHYEFETNVALDEFKVCASSDTEAFGSVPLFNKHLITINFKDAPLEDVMNAIVKQMNNYDWEINDDVVNIFPVRGRDERLKKLLDVKVRSFAVGMGATVTSIQAELMLFQPEFKAFLAENKLEFETGRSGSSFLDRVLPDGIAYSDMTFKQLFNAITKSKRGGWMLQIKKQSDKPGKEFVEILI